MGDLQIICNGLTAAGTGAGTVVSTTITETIDNIITKKETATTVTKEEKDGPGFQFMIALLPIIAVGAIILFRRQKK